MESQEKPFLKESKQNATILDLHPNATSPDSKKNETDPVLKKNATVPVSHEIIPLTLSSSNGSSEQTATLNATRPKHSKKLKTID